MLFSYQYINHSMERMQEFVDYIFYKVWCEAPVNEYEVEVLFSTNADLLGIIQDFHNTEPKGAEFFIRGIQEVFLIFKTLNTDEIEQLKTWYQSNNSIEDLCKNDPTVTPVTYDDVSRMNTDLSAALKAFFEKLYSHDFLSLKVLSDKIGLIDNHYTEFVKINSKGKCPYCGLYDIDGEYVHTREAYDHYLPKSKYPFSSINFKNLAPICNKCNSGNKGSKDPLHDTNGNRRKTFYSYNSVPYSLEINLIFNSHDLENLTPQDITITFGPTSLEEEFQTWNELFGIDERYKAKCCSADAKYWVTQILDESQEYGLTSREFLRCKIKESERNPYSELNFLRKPFLEACEAQHVFP
ncbi:hypothetical protein DSECCO2_274170 [anaerobic digester metagenome]